MEDGTHQNQIKGRVLHGKLQTSIGPIDIDGADITCNDPVSPEDEKGSWCRIYYSYNTATVPKSVRGEIAGLNIEITNDLSSGFNVTWDGVPTLATVAKDQSISLGGRAYFLKSGTQIGFGSGSVINMITLSSEDSYSIRGQTFVAEVNSQVSFSDDGSVASIYGFNSHNPILIGGQSYASDGSWVSFYDDGHVSSLSIAGDMALLVAAHDLMIRKPTQRYDLMFYESGVPKQVILAQDAVLNVGQISLPFSSATYHNDVEFFENGSVKSGSLSQQKQFNLQNHTVNLNAFSLTMFYEDGTLASGSITINGGWFSSGVKLTKTDGSIVTLNDGIYQVTFNQKGELEDLKSQ
jgi:hypothetical protein